MDCNGFVHPPFSPGADWSSLDAGVAACDASGMATAVGPGGTTIRARWEAYDNSYCETRFVEVAAAALQKRDKRTAQEAVDRLAAINPQNPALQPLRESIARIP